MKEALKAPPADVSESEALGHLNEILASKSFAASPRCQQFLSFVVKETLEGRSDSIKERTIAMEVFGKDHHFEPGEDSLVRVKAREVRKRLAEFYQGHPSADVRIDLPLGGYVPRIEATPLDVPVPVPLAAPPVMSPPEASSLQEPKRISRRAMLWSGIAAAGVAITYPLIRYSNAPTSNLDLFWKPVFATRTPLLIAIPVLKTEAGEITDRVGMGAAAAVNEAAEYFVNVRYPYRLRFGSDLTFAQLREQPSLLLGGFSSAWTTRMTSTLRYALVRNDDGRPGGYVRDSQTGTIFGPILTKNGYASEDYAIVCRLFDAASGQITLIAAGITTFGTESAARFFFRPALFEQLIKSQAKDWQKKSFQAVIKINVIETTPSAPSLVATHFW